MSDRFLSRIVEQSYLVLRREWGNGLWDYYWGLYRDYYRDPFPHSLRSTRENLLHNICASSLPASRNMGLNESATQIRPPAHLIAGLQPRPDQQLLQGTEANPTCGKTASLFTILRGKQLKRRSATLTTRATNAVTTPPSLHRVASGALADNHCHCWCRSGNGSWNGSGRGSRGGGRSSSMVSWAVVQLPWWSCRSQFEVRWRMASCGSSPAKN